MQSAVRRATFTLRCGHGFTRTSHTAPLLTMVMRDEFDASLVRFAVDAGATLLDRTAVRAVTPLADGLRLDLGTRCCVPGS